MPVAFQKSACRGSCLAASFSKNDFFAFGEGIFPIKFEPLLGGKFGDAVEQIKGETVAALGRGCRRGERAFRPGSGHSEASLISVFRHAEFTQAIETEGGDFEIELAPGFRRFAAEHVDVPLKKFAQPAFLRALGAETAGNAEPFDRARQAVGLRGDHAREGGREFRAEGELGFVFAAGFSK